MPYQLGRQSLNHLSGVKPELANVVKRAIQLTNADFTVFDGARTKEQQREYVRRGVSQTMHSKHLVHADGFGYAVDLVPWIEGKPVWDHEVCCMVAYAMYLASTELDVPVTWGCVWDRLLGELEGVKTWRDLKQAGLDYNKRHPGTDFPDAPHFQFGRN